MQPKSIKFVRMTIQEATTKLLFQLYHVYDNREAANIADMVMENVTGWKRIDRVVHKHVKVSRECELKLEKITAELLNHKPVQYALNEAWFYGLKFYVDENVLIPRPETEELVEWVIRSSPASHVLDIGTGSGCIAIAIKKKIPVLTMYACDISEAALAVASKNAAALETHIQLLNLDIFDRNEWDVLPRLNTIISNPPYIPFEEKLKMDDNVVQYEPHLALFVKDSDPLIFYRAIAEFAKKKLIPDGDIFVETHENLADAVAALFEVNQFRKIEIRKDMQGKKRMVHIKK
jgi:release factor glutamine methyltransferase